MKGLPARVGRKRVISIEEGGATKRQALFAKHAGELIGTVAGNILATAIKTTQCSGSVTCCGNVGSAISSSIYPFILNVTLLGIS